MLAGVDKSRQKLGQKLIGHRAVHHLEGEISLVAEISHGLHLRNRDSFTGHEEKKTKKGQQSAVCVIKTVIPDVGTALCIFQAFL